MRVLYILLLLFMSIFSIEAQRNYNFQYLTNTDGLSSGAISSIYQDSTGIMWLGSWDGLNTYDGRNVTVYKSIPNDPNTLTNNTILDIIGGRVKDEIWITTFRGVNRLNTKSKNIDRFFFGFDSIMPSYYNTFNTVRAGETIYCSIYGASIFYYNPEINNFEPLDVLGKNDFVTKMLSDNRNNLWIQCNHTDLYRYTPIINSDGSQEVGQCVQILENIDIRLIFKKDEYNFWIIDSNQILYLFDTHTNQLTLITSLAGKVAGEISSMVQKEDNIFIATSKSGLWVYSYRNNELSTLDGFESQWVFSMTYSAKQNILWFGTNGNGVIKMYPNNRLFNSIENNELLQFYKKSQIRSIYEDVNGDIWIGSRGDGISIISAIGTENQKIRHLASTRNKSIMSIVRGEGNDILIGTESEALFLYRNNTLVSIDMPQEVKESLGSSGIYSILWNSKRNVLWIGTDGKGLFRFDMVNSLAGYRIEKYKRYYNNPSKANSISNDNCFAILPVDSTHLWIGTRGGGLNLMNIEEETFTTINRNSKVPLSDDEVFSLAHSKDGGVWIGTSYGLNKLTVDQQGQMSIKHYTEDDGILNNTIHGIVEDDQETVWISTNKGITKIETQSGTIVNYSNGYGLQSNEFSDLAYLKASNGVIYFGGINGINYFLPSQITERNFVPQIKITSLVINNTQIFPSDKMRTEKGEEVLFLEYKENFFNVNFVALDFINNSNCEYMYILEGFNKEWIKSGINNSAVFTNVPSGRYTLRIRSTNGDKVWVNNEYSQTIVIGEPFWNTWQAYVFYTIILGLTILAIYTAISKRIKRRRSLLIETLEQQQQQQVHDARLRFFTNIAQEFITPLTLIYAPVERLLSSKRMDEKDTRYLKVIKANSERMQKLIGELMNFRKMDLVHQELSLEQVDLSELVLYIADNFTRFAEQMSIRFNSRIIPDDAQWVTDRSCLEKILFNLISNAYKYTNENGYIDLNITIENDRLVMVLRNTGKGIKAGDLNSVFDNYHILDHFERQLKEGVIRRTGIGLALTKSLVTHLGGEIKVSSEENQFVEFWMCLPCLSLPESKVTTEPFVVEKEDEVVVEKAQKQSVLIVENEYQIRELLKDILEDNYTIIEAGNGLEALEQIKKKRPDLIISDIEMPQMSGIELLEELKNNKFTNHIPVIFLSARATIEDQILGMKKGLEYLIPKPFNPRHVEVVVNQILNSRRSLKDYYSSPVDDTHESQEKLFAPEDEEFMNKITQIIESNIENEELNPTFICNEMIISRIQLYRKLKKIADIAPSDFIRQVKLNYAVKLLKTTNLTVQEIMFKSGFNNRSYFYSVFKKEFNASPLDLRDNK